MEQRHPDSVLPSEKRYQSDGQKDRADGLDRDGQEQVQPCQAAEVRQGGSVHGFADQHPSPDGDFPAERDHDHRREDHKAQAAHLDQNQQDDLPEDREGRPCIHGDQPGHADRGRRRKQAVEQADALPASGGSRQCQQNGSQQDHGQKAESKDALGMLKSFPFLLYRKAHCASSVVRSCRSIRYPIPICVWI